MRQSDLFTEKPVAGPLLEKDENFWKRNREISHVHSINSKEQRNVVNLHKMPTLYGQASNIKTSNAAAMKLHPSPI